MVWYCNKHKCHSIDDECSQCNEDAIQPQVDAWIAGWNARHDLLDFDSEWSLSKRDELLGEFKASIRRGRLKGTHDSG